MKITALDIRQKTFEKSFRGIDRDEVQAFLTMLSQQWERLGDENRELRLKLDHTQQDVQKLREVESSLYRTLKTAEDTGASITEQAQREADLRRREAQLAAEQVLAEARQQARALLDEARQAAERAVAEMQQHVSGLGQECQRLENQFDALVRDLHHLASDALDKAERARARPKNGPAAILARANGVQVPRPASGAPGSGPEAGAGLDSGSMAAASAFSVPTAAAPAAAAGSPAASVSAASIEPATAVAASSAAAYNPKPGQQPEPDRGDPFAPDSDPAPGTPATPTPDIERPGAPAENPGIAPPPRIDQPSPDRVTEPELPPAMPPSYPEIAPLTPGGPEIGQPSPSPYPSGERVGTPKQYATEASGEHAGRSFFDEI